jgi:hypothetical protein
VITDTLAWQGDASGWSRIIIGLYGADGGRAKLPSGEDFQEIARNPD